MSTFVEPRTVLLPKVSTAKKKAANYARMFTVFHLPTDVAKQLARARDTRSALFQDFAFSRSIFISTEVSVPDSGMKMMHVVKLPKI